MFSLAARSAPRLSLRLYSTAPPKQSLKDLVATLRNHAGPDVSPTQAAQALLATDRDIPAALKWLETNRAEAAAKKAAKVADRTTAQGLVGAAVLARGAPGGVRAALVELNCETDFVARNALFGALLADIAHTAAFLAEPAPSAPSLVRPFALDALRAAPLLSARTPGAPAHAGTVADALRTLVGQVGENIALRRAATLTADALRPPELALRASARVHQSVGDPLQGRIGSLALLALKAPALPVLLREDGFQADLEKLAGALGRQIIGFPTTAIRAPGGAEDEGALYAQPFEMYGGEGSGVLVAAFLKKWAHERGMADQGEEGAGVEVVEFAKWTVGE
ncbi:EF-TsMt 2, partial [Amylocystis lapponica]